ncbi:MAG: hypothetical protein Fur0041_05390 [Bacteroidia bacterium]
MMKKLILCFTIFSLPLSISAQQVNDFLYAKMNGRVLLETGDSTWFWGYGHYNGSQLSPMSLPAPLLNYQKGDTMVMMFKNLSPEAHTIHFHGTDADQRNDGVPHTWPQVNPGDSTTYSISLNYPGSFLYHCHVMTIHHLAMGMYGMMIVKNFPDTSLLFDNGPGFNRSYPFLMSDMDTMWNNNPIAPGHLHDFDANYFMVNGKAGWLVFAEPGNNIEAYPGDSVALHFGNVGYTTVKLTFPQGANATVYQSDGRVLPQPFNADTLRLYPGERYEVILRPTTMIYDWISVEHLNAILDQPEGLNYIGINSYQHPSSVPENAHQQVNLIYPNPADDFFVVESTSNEQILVVDLNGRVVKAMQTTAGNNRIYCDDLPGGLYTVTTFSGKKYKLVITH